jgi:hypothetical protein
MQRLSQGEVLAGGRCGQGDGRDRRSGGSVSAMISDMASATGEQSEGISQVSTAISHLDR